MNLLVHIGLGKTGSSSIQKTLEKNRDLLKKDKIFYLGEFFEHSPVQIFDWQKKSGIEEFYATQSQCASLTELLAKTLASLEETGYKLAILSNEWLGGCSYEAKRNAEIIKAIKKVASINHEITCCAYVRDHLSWSVSAYQQWGIKNKTMTRINSYAEYTHKRPPLFAETLGIWRGACKHFRLFNYNSIADVTEHFFFTVLGLDAKSWEMINANKQFKDNELFIRACFNEFLSPDSPIRDFVFDSYFSPANLGSERFKERGYYEWYTSLLPSAADLKTIDKYSRFDVDKINNYLASSNEPLLDPQDSLELASEKLGIPAMPELIDFLIAVSFNLAQENYRLRKMSNHARK